MLQVRVDEPPEATEVGEALKLRVGAAGGGGGGKGSGSPKKVDLSR